MDEASKKNVESPQPLNESERTFRDISNALHGLQYGYIQIIVQDGVIVQIDRMEKKRIRTSRSPGREKS